MAAEGSQSKPSFLLHDLLSPECAIGIMSSLESALAEVLGGYIEGLGIGMVYVQLGSSAITYCHAPSCHGAIYPGSIQSQLEGVVETVYIRSED